MHKPVCRNVGCFGIGADGASAIADAVANRQAGHAVADRFDKARRFHAETRGKGYRVKTRTMIGIDEIDADGGVAHARLAPSRRRQVDILVLQHIGAACLLEPDGLHRSLVSRSASRL